MFNPSPRTPGTAIDNLQILDRIINLQRRNFPLSRTNVATMFDQETPRSPDLTLKVLDKIRGAVRENPLIMSILETYIETLRSHGFDQAIEEGLVTYTMFKPNIGKGLYQQNAIPESQEAAYIAQLIKEFREGRYRNVVCEVMAPLSLVMTPETFEQFYAGNKEWQSKIPVDNFPPYVQIPDDKNLFRMVESVMLSGPTTPAIVYSPNGNAIDNWRTILGPSNPEADRLLEKYRGTYRAEHVDLSANTHIHGSGKAKPPQKEGDEVRQEAGLWLPKRLEEIMQAAA